MRSSRSGTRSEMKSSNFHLTDRELGILREMVKGLSIKEIASKLDVSQSTLKVSRSRIYKKLQVSSATQAVRLVNEFNLLTNPLRLDIRETNGQTSPQAGRAASWVWDSPRVKAILEQPEGTPIDLSALTEDERDELARDAKGMWADHPYIKDSVEWVRDLRKSLFKGIPEE